MKFKIDENLPVEISDLLNQHGFDSMTVFDQELNGEMDPKIATICREEERALITLDKDFSDIRSYRPDEFSGIIVLRLSRQDKPHIVKVFTQILELLSTEPLKGHLWIVDEERIRIRS